MTRSKLGDLHPYDPEIHRTFHRSIVLHYSVVLDSSIVHTDFITDSISEPSFSAFESEISVENIPAFIEGVKARWLLLSFSFSFHVSVYPICVKRMMV